MKEDQKFFTKIKAFLTSPDEDFFQEENDSMSKAGAKTDTSSSTGSTGFEDISSGTKEDTSFGSSGYSDRYHFDETSLDRQDFSTDLPYSDSFSQSSNLYKIPAKPKFVLSILRLEKLEDAVKVADEIVSGNTITFLDLRHVHKDIVRRMVDFIDGVRYTCDAKMEIVADYTYVLVPKDVELTGDLFSQLDTSSLS